MEVIDTPLVGVKIIQPKVFGDSRGFFLETFEKQRYQELLNIDLEFVQDNHSRSSKGCVTWSALPERTSSGQVGSRSAR